MDVGVCVQNDLINAPVSGFQLWRDSLKEKKKRKERRREKKKEKKKKKKRKKKKKLLAVGYDEWAYSVDPGLSTAPFQRKVWGFSWKRRRSLAGRNETNRPSFSLGHAGKPVRGSDFLFMTDN